jgi:D-alanyl-D-alanine carboxypeptidase
MTGTFVVSLVIPLLVVSAARAQQPAARLPEQELFARIAVVLDSLDRGGEFSGVVALGKSGRPVFQRAVGYSNRDARTRNDTATAFNLGSINKLFTQIAIRQLAAAGKLQLDSTLSRYWPDYPNSEVARRVTIRQLLEHRAGIGGDIFAAPSGQTRHALRHNRDYLALFVDRPLDFEPGTSQRYSNAGYVVLGGLVERVSGQDYYAYLREYVYGPAGMHRTAHWHVDSLPPNTATGYRGRDDRRPNTTLLPGRGSAAGGGYSTVGNLLQFVQALRERRVPAGPPAGVGAAGGAPGLNAVLDGDLPGGYDLVVLANLDPPAAERVARNIRQLLGSND